MVYYFSYLDPIIKTIDPHAEIQPSQGVLRSLFAHLYSELATKTKNHPGKSPQEILDEIAESKEPLIGFEIRGLGSDFDVLVKVSKEPKHQTFETIKEKVAEITSSTEQFLNLSGDDKLDKALKRSLVPIVDVKSLERIGSTVEEDSQIDRAARQGGATIDDLSFKLDLTGEHGHFIEPEGYHFIVSDFIRGYYRYLPPKPGEEKESPEKQTVRGIRPLFEMGFLRILDDTLLRQEWAGLKEDLANKKQIPEDVLEQFARIRRNSRDAGAHNRIYRASTNSLDQDIKTYIEAAQELNLVGNGYALIPEYTQIFPIPELGRPLNGVPGELLMPLEQFLNHYTVGGTVHHGTPSVSDSLSILRQGIYVTDNADFRKGSYFSPDPTYSHGYTGTAGVVLI